jgi:hypothetical protein
MRPAVKRRLVTLAAAASLLLCVATVAMWVRSYWVKDTLLYAPGQVPLAYVVLCRSGTLIAGRIPSFDLQQQARLEHRATSTNLGRTPFPIEERFLGVGWLSMTFRSVGLIHPSVSGKYLYLIKAPIWMVFVISVPLPATWVARRRLCRGGETVRCPACGYDLRATPERCPECGAVPAATAAR